MTHEPKWRMKLARFIAPNLFAHRHEEAVVLAQFDYLGLTPGQKNEAIHAAAMLSACGALPHVDVFAKISARGCITNEDIHQLAERGVKTRLDGNYRQENP